MTIPTTLTMMMVVAVVVVVVVVVALYLHRSLHAVALKMVN
jgi:hypothetical protein